MNAREETEGNVEMATLGGGCFWCTEAVFKSIRGVIKVEPGYSGGRPEDATYERVSTGRTGHAEVVQVTFDPEEISFGAPSGRSWRYSSRPTTPPR